MKSATHSKGVRAGSGRTKWNSFLAATAAACLVPVAAAQAGGTIAFGDGESVSLGLGMRTSFTSVESGAPNGSSRSADFNLDSVRIYMGGSINDNIKATFNTERDGNGGLNVLDGYAQFEFMPEFNIWVGRMLPPSDRANLDGPYYLNNWYYPGVVSQYPAKFAGRDDGATIWGKVFDKKLVYSVGTFMGHNRITGASNQGDNMLWAGRIAYNFLDAEDDPAYYTSSTYYGSADILTLAFAGQYQKNGVGTALNKGDYTGWNLDLLFEKPFDFGTLTFEGAYYQYDTDGKFDVAPGFGGASGTANVGGITQGTGYLLGADYMFPGEVGWGKVQPFFRYQDFDADLTGTTSKQYDVGVNYVIKAHNARISLDFTQNESNKIKDFNQIVLGIQLQF